MSARDNVIQFLNGTTILAGKHNATNSMIRLASNESPRPPFPPVLSAISELLTQNTHLYPDIGCGRLTTALARHLNRHTDEILVAGGATSLIRLAARVFSGPQAPIISADPSFAMYAIAADMASAPLISTPLNVKLRVDLDAMLGAISPQVGLIFLCNPNNPTGTSLDFDNIKRFVEQVPEHVAVVIDEAYLEYVTNPGFRSAISLVNEHPNLVVLRTFSKVYALAGLRIGYAVAQPPILRRLLFHQARDTITSVSQRAALEALKHPDLVVERVATNASERSRVFTALKSMGVDVIQSQANFHFIRSGPHGKSLHQPLFDRNILTRKLTTGAIRVSIGTPEQNNTFLNAILDIITKR